MCRTAQVSNSIGCFTGFLELVFANNYNLNSSFNKLMITAKRSQSTSRSTDNKIQLNRLTSRLKGKVKCTLVRSLRLCTGRTAHRGSRGIALPFHDHGTRKGWVVSVTPRPLFTPRKTWYHCTGPRGRYGQMRKISLPPGFDPRTVQPVASRYNDYATRPTSRCKRSHNLCSECYGFELRPWHQLSWRPLVLFWFPASYPSPNKNIKGQLFKLCHMPRPHPTEPFVLRFWRTSQLPPCSIYLPEKLTGLQLVKKFPAFYETRQFITTVTSAHQPFPVLSQRYLFHASPSHFLKIYFNIILPYKPMYSKWFLSIRSPHQNPVRTAPFPIYSAHYILLDLPLWLPCKKFNKI